MDNYQDAGKGLKKMFIATIGMMSCALLILVPVINIFALIAVIVFLIVNAYGTYQVGKDIPGVRTAFYLQMVALVLTVFSNFIGLFDVVETILSMVAMWLIFSSISKVMEEHGKEELAEKGKRAMWINLACSIYALVSDYLLSIQGGWALLILSLILPIIAFVLQIKFYKESAEQFGEYL